MLAHKPHGIDEVALDAYLRQRLPDLKGQVHIESVAGGQSNPTFFVSYDNHKLVLRKKPVGALPSAHAVDREYRVMTALRETDLPVPETLFYCGDESVLGTAFYVMRRLEGRVFSDSTLPGVKPSDRQAIYMEMADILAKLHAVDFSRAGLADFGKAGNYFERQVARWTKQWQLSKERDLASIDYLVEWLPAHIPAEDETTIAHGDFRLGNLMFHPDEPKVIGVLDWELSTLGHPLADVAYSALTWHLGSTEYMGIRDLDFRALGIPEEGTYLERYSRASGRRETVKPFHFAFSLFRLAVIFEGIAARARLGNASSENAAEVGKLTSTLAQRAVEEITC